jgi:hypothetical protein
MPIPRSEAAQYTEGGSQVGQAGAAVPRQIKKAADGRHHQYPREHEQHGRSEQGAGMVRGRGEHHLSGALRRPDPGGLYDQQGREGDQRSGGNVATDPVGDRWCVVCGVHGTLQCLLTGAVPILQTPPSVFSLGDRIGSTGASVSIAGMTFRAVHITLAGGTLAGLPPLG